MSRWIPSAACALGAALCTTIATPAVHCSSGEDIGIIDSSEPVEYAKVAQAMCQVLKGAAVQGIGGGLGRPMSVVLVDEVQAERLNAQYVNPRLMAQSAGHVEITHDLLSRFTADEVAFALAHETAHQINHDGLSLEVLGILRLALAVARLLAPLYALKRYIRSGRPHWQFAKTLIAIPGCIAVAVASITASTVLIAAVSTQFEFAADAKGLHLLVASGWSADRAIHVFHQFLAESPNRDAGSWFDLERHPSNFERDRAVQRLRLGPSHTG